MLPSQAGKRLQHPQTEWVRIKMPNMNISVYTVNVHTDTTSGNGQPNQWDASRPHVPPSAGQGGHAIYMRVSGFVAKNLMAALTGGYPQSGGRVHSNASTGSNATRPPAPAVSWQPVPAAMPRQPVPIAVPRGAVPQSPMFAKLTAEIDRLQNIVRTLQDQRAAGKPAIDEDKQLQEAITGLETHVETYRAKRMGAQYSIGVHKSELDQLFGHAWKALYYARLGQREIAISRVKEVSSDILPVHVDLLSYEDRKSFRSDFATLVNLIKNKASSWSTGDSASLREMAYRLGQLNRKSETALNTLVSSSSNRFSPSEIRRRYESIDAVRKLLDFAGSMGASDAMPAAVTTRSAPVNNHGSQHGREALSDVDPLHVELLTPRDRESFRNHYAILKSFAQRGDSPLTAVEAEMLRLRVDNLHTLNRICEVALNKRVISADNRYSAKQIQMRYESIDKLDSVLDSARKVLASVKGAATRPQN